MQKTRQLLSFCLNEGVTEPSGVSLEEMKSAGREVDTATLVLIRGRADHVRARLRFLQEQTRKCQLTLAALESEELLVSGERQ